MVFEEAAVSLKGRSRPSLSLSSSHPLTSQAPCHWPYLQGLPHHLRHKDQQQRSISPTEEQVNPPILWCHLLISEPVSTSPPSNIIQHDPASAITPLLYKSRRWAKFVKLPAQTNLEFDLKKGEEMTWCNLITMLPVIRISPPVISTQMIFYLKQLGAFKSREREQSDFFLTFLVIGIWRGVFFNSLLSLLGDHLNFFAGDLWGGR